VGKGSDTRVSGGSSAETADCRMNVQHWT
jgi:hypothetical protein